MDRKMHLHDHRLVSRGLLGDVSYSEHKGQVLLDALKWP